MSDTNTNSPAENNLEHLIGAWRNEITIPLDPPILVYGQTTFERLGDDPFLVVRDTVENLDFPNMHAIIGRDDTTDSYSMLYFDSRGISRIYQMSLSAQEWKLWREAPEFHQRFTGTFSDDGNTITGCWEILNDGSDWEHDFDLTYIRIN